jgi:hypothetical protein
MYREPTDTALAEATIDRGGGLLNCTLVQIDFRRALRIIGLHLSYRLSLAPHHRGVFFVAPEPPMMFAPDVEEAIERFAKREELSREEALELLVRDWLNGHGLMDARDDNDPVTPVRLPRHDTLGE